MFVTAILKSLDLIHYHYYYTTTKINIICDKNQVIQYVGSKQCSI